ncbi:MAG TPA: hypothetical protein VK551_04670 [Thermodesulfobacteriota bacterium]|jgi:hypothetical protein|nr:hypothetical protein [Thermodesulfobacteriota bacterium]
MDKRIFILMMAVVLGLGIFGCAGEKAVVKTAPSQILPVKVTVDSVERLNAIAAKPPFQPTDLLVFRVNFKLSNPNNVVAKVDDLYFEAKVDDGTPDKTIIQAVSMPSYLVPAGGEIIWSSTEPFLYGGVRASYLLRGVGGEGGMQGVFKKMEELWIDLGGDNRKFYIDGNITTSLPDFSAMGIVRTQFKSEFAIPKL